MKIQARKIYSTPKSFSLEKDIQGDIVKLSGEIQEARGQGQKGLFLLKGRLSGEITLVCDISGEEYQKKLDEELVLYISDGLWDAQSQSLETFDVIEFFDGFIDLDFILQSEIESIKLDYHHKGE